MKPLLLLTIAWLLLGISTISAQDLILKRDGDYISVHVAEVSQTTIKYRRADQENGPIYSIAVAEVRAIRYQDGTMDEFEEKSETTSPPMTNTAPPAKDSRPTKGSVILNRNGPNDPAPTLKDSQQGISQSGEDDSDEPYWLTNNHHTIYYGGTLTYAGGMYAYTGKTLGVYLAGRYGTDYYQYAEQDKIAVTAGLMLRTYGPVYLYSGLGYGDYYFGNYFTGYRDFISGLELEGGIMVNLWGVDVLLGYSTTSFYYTTQELTFGLGYGF